MSNERLQQLTLLSAESEVMRDVTFESIIIQNFADKQTRKYAIA